MDIASQAIGDAVSLLIGSKAPILFIDTCAILDILRLPFREKLPSTAKSYLESAQKTLHLANSNKLHIIILPNVPTEYSDNMQATKDELSRHLKTLAQRLDVLSVLHLSSPSQILVPNLISINTESFLESICNKLISSGLHISQDDIITLRATNKVIQNIPPSRKGALKDCIIYEHALEIASLLRNQMFNDNIVFFTSNTKDYCENNGRAKQQIKDDFINLNIELCTNWSWALSSCSSTE